jgi:hypothetical protein
MLHERDITVDSGLLQGQIVNNDRLEYEVPPPQDTEQSVHSDHSEYGHGKYFTHLLSEGVLPYTVPLTGT